MSRMTWPPAIIDVGLYLALWLVAGSTWSIQAQSVPVRTLTLQDGVVDVVWDTTRSRFFASSGTNVLIINPETVQVEDTIPIGSPANKIAISDNGQYLYVSLGFFTESLGMINRYQIQNHSLDFQIALGTYTGGNILRDVYAMVALPGQPKSILVATTDRRLVVYDGAVARPGIAALGVHSLYVRPSDGAIFGVGDSGQSTVTSPQMFSFSISTSGVAPARSVPVDLNWENANTITWNGSLATTRNPFTSLVFDLSAGTTIGRVPVPPVSTQESGACVLAADATGKSVFAYQYKYQYADSITDLVQYSLPSFQLIASSHVAGLAHDDISVSSVCSAAWTWGKDGILIRGDQGQLLFLHTAGLSPLTLAPIPTSTQDAAGVIHLALPANGLIYDSARNLLWASIPGNGGTAGNSVVSIDPATGNVVDTIPAGSEPGAMALSGDGSHLFAALGGASAVAAIDLSTKQSSSFSVLDSSNSLHWSVASLAAIGGQGNSVVAVRTASDYTSSVVAYDAGMPRKNTFNSGQGANLYQQYVQAIFPAEAADAFYATNTAINYPGETHDMFRLVVDSTGVRLDTQLNNLFLGSGPASLVYDSGGSLPAADRFSRRIPNKSSVRLF